MNIIHRRIQEKLKESYEKQGYFVEKEKFVNIGESRYYVDVVATKGKEKIAIEVGQINELKMKRLKKIFTKVEHIPYITRTEDGFCEHICGHIWRPRVDFPIECPACKCRLNWGNKNE